MTYANDSALDEMTYDHPLQAPPDSSYDVGGTFISPNYTIDSNETVRLWSDLPEVQLSQNLWRYVPPFILILGTTGNCLSAIVMMRYAFRRSTIGPYFTVLAISDTIVLYTGLCVHWLANTFDIYATSVNIHLCRLVFFSLYWSTGVSAWILVAVTWERVLAVSSTSTNTPKYRTRVILTIIALTMFLINAHHFWTLIGDPYDYAGRTYIDCKVSETFLYFGEYIWPWINLSINSLIPFVLLLTGNIFIICRIVFVQFKLKKLQFQTGPRSVRGVRTGSVSGSGRKIPSMTVVLLLVTFVFVFTTAPYCLFPIIQPLLDDEDQPTSYNTGARHVLGLTIIEILSYVNNAINFWLYCISGSRFRKELVATFSPFQRDRHGPGRGSGRGSYALQRHPPSFETGGPPMLKLDHGNRPVATSVVMINGTTRHESAHRMANGKWKGL